MNLKISAAVAAALAVSAPAFALDPTATLNAPVQLTVSGASAARDAFGALMANSICATGFNVYRASPSTGTDFRAYSCTLANAPELGTAAGQNATVYYRAEGGSAWGPVPIALNNRQVMRLRVDTTCSTTATISLPGVAVAQVMYQCPVPAGDYVLDTDVSTSADANLILDNVDLGVSDEEPKMYGAPNFPSSTRLTTVPGFTTAAQRQAALNALNPAATPGFGQVFGIIVNNGQGAIGGGNASIVNSPFNAQTNPVLSRQTLAGIFNGTYRNWNVVPTITGGTVSATSLTIRICRREPGSGTQVSANQYFLSTPQCSSSTLGSFRTDGADNDGVNVSATSYINDTDGVIERGTGSDLNTCVAGLAGGIGPTVANAAPAGTTFIAINGTPPSRNAAAVGTYDYYYEQTYQVNPALGAGPVQDLANGLVTLSQPAVSTPNVLSAVALPNASNDPFSQGAFGTGQPPVAFATRGGNSCLDAGPLSP
jgi:hypothetical protein